jgi:hypothetical protein
VVQRGTKSFPQYRAQALPSYLICTAHMRFLGSLHNLHWGSTRARDSGSRQALGLGENPQQQAIRLLQADLKSTSFLSTNILWVRCEMLQMSIVHAILPLRLNGKKRWGYGRKRPKKLHKICGVSATFCATTRATWRQGKSRHANLKAAESQNRRIASFSSTHMLNITP